VPEQHEGDTVVLPGEPAAGEPPTVTGSEPQPAATPAPTATPAASSQPAP
jgi:hypothetical protein